MACSYDILIYRKLLEHQNDMSRNQQLFCRVLNELNACYLVFTNVGTCGERKTEKVKCYGEKYISSIRSIFAENGLSKSLSTLGLGSRSIEQGLYRIKVLQRNGLVIRSKGTCQQKRNILAQLRNGYADNIFTRPFAY